MRRIRKNTFAGFTLLEMVISIIIGSIIISLSYEGIANLRTMWNKFQTQQTVVTSLLLFKEALDYDIDKSTVVVCESPNSYLLLSTIDTIHYSFNKRVTRELGNEKDTFLFAVTDSRYNLVTIESSLPIVNKLFITIELNNERQEIVFLKHYSSSDLLPLATLVNEH